MAVRNSVTQCVKMTVAKTPYVKTPSQSNLSDCEAVAMAAEECAITSTEYRIKVKPDNIQPNLRDRHPKPFCLGMCSIEKGRLVYIVYERIGTKYMKKYFVQSQTSQLIH